MLFLSETLPQLTAYLQLILVLYLSAQSSSTCSSCPAGTYSGMAQLFQALSVLQTFKKTFKQSETAFILYLLYLAHNNISVFPLQCLPHVWIICSGAVA